MILAAGSGSRMRKRNAVFPPPIPPKGAVAPDVTAAADRGLKALVPVGRPFLDYVLHAVAEAGFRRVCLVIGRRGGAIRERYASTRRLEVACAVQDEPRGTADALLSAESFVAENVVESGDFAVLNGDNYYPPEALRRLRALDGPGLVGFDRGRMLARGETNVTHERMAAFAVVEATDGELRGLVEKPDAATYAALPEPVCVSFNCWRLPPSIFAACGAIAPSPRGELELTDAVVHAVERGERFRLAVSDAPVLDLTGRDDIAPVRELLATVEVDL